ncbi:MULTISPECIES: thrombospondin type 3 repeat-containing protein [Sorangium]|uniref:Uncharacterized protein n=1 Tax=Sorangium cellulosum TaxID=56 RepID=A0A4P2R0G4_SORCE|nr:MULTISPECIES: thrombospondin type 3 repeat-containing protein [Sorangium]AUX36414.1 uncharacterized protein SOCE836_086210 [Sorangium cellulosum]WCQ95711.1 hypothetical protein NQZ70_08488 [Sorangium sp. Soce836]
MKRLAVFSVVAAGALLSSAAAHAVPPSGSIALNQLDPTPPGDAFFGVASPTIGGHLVPRGVLMLDHSRSPLSLSSHSVSGDVVGSQTFLHLAGSLALWDRLLVSLLMPIAVSQDGDSPSVGSTTFSSPRTAQAGDLRLGARVRLIGEDQDVFQLGIGVSAHFPTGPSNSYVGEGAVRLSPSLLVGGRVRRVMWSAGLGMVARASSNPASLTTGGGIGVLLLDSRLHVGAELFTSTLLQQGAFHVTEQRRIPLDLFSTGAELLLGARGRVYNDVLLGVAAGPGLTTAIGNPAFRFIGSVSWSPAVAPQPRRAQDPDEDGILDTADACPYAFGPRSDDPKRHGCPRWDLDEDGVDDLDDACPDAWGVKSEDKTKNGCPLELPSLDRDGDGISDAEDACPDEKGEPLKGDAAKRGCPVTEQAPDSGEDPYQ